MSYELKIHSVPCHPRLTRSKCMGAHAITNSVIVPSLENPEASSSPSTSAIVDDGGGRRLAARGQQPVSIDERARPLDRSVAMHDPTFVSAPQRCDRPSMRSTQPPINMMDLRSCRVCTSVVVCIRCESKPAFILHASMPDENKPIGQPRYRYICTSKSTRGIPRYR